MSRRDSLGDDRTSVVVCHDMLWSNHGIVPGLDHLVSGESDGILLNDLLDDSLRYPGTLSDGGEPTRG